VDSWSLSSSAVSEATGEHNNKFTKQIQKDSSQYFLIVLQQPESKREFHLVIESRITQFLPKANKLLLHNLLLVR